MTPTDGVSIAQGLRNHHGFSFPHSYNQEPDFARCPRCGSSKIWKNGYRDYPHQHIQRYVCAVCNYRFSESCSGLSETSNSSSAGLESRITKENANRMTQENASSIATAIQGASNGDITHQNDLFNYAWYLKKEGLKESTVETYVRFIRTLRKRGAILAEPESVKRKIAEQDWDPKRKQNAVNAYTHYLQMNNGIWNPPRYKELDKPVFLPKETEIDALITSTGLKTSVLLQCLKETGARIGEILNLTWSDIDFESNVLRITPEKGSKARILRISSKLIHRLRHVQNVNQVTDPTRIFSAYKTAHRTYLHQRKNIARKLANERLLKISFHTFRHWHATKLYHETGDIYFVQRRLGHKNIVNTMRYINLSESYFGEEEEEYITKVAETIEQALPLIEQGYTEAADYQGVKIFKIRKTRLGKVS